MKTFIYILRIATSIILLIVGIPALFIEGMLLLGIFLIIIALILLPKYKIHSKTIDSNPFFEVLSIYLIIDYFFSKKD